MHVLHLHRFQSTASIWNAMPQRRRAHKNISQSGAQVCGSGAFSSHMHTSQSCTTDAAEIDDAVIKTE
jgi:hypothetical protein